MEKSFDDIKSCYISSLLKEIIKNINSNEDKEYLTNMLSHYKYNSGGDINTRICSTCGELKNNKEFYYEKIYGTKNDYKITYICSDCHDYQLTHYRIFAKIRQIIPQPISVPSSLCDYTWETYCNRCESRIAFDNYWEYENVEPPKKCINCKIFPFIQFARERNNDYRTNRKEEEIINNVITDEYMNMFLMFKNIRRKLTKLKKENHETS